MTKHFQFRQYDAVIVGGRVAGAATGLLLARSGARVLIIERDQRIGDTLSTHALMRSGVVLLQKWGVLDQLQDAGTPVINHTCFHYDKERVDIPIPPKAGTPGLIAPRRWLLDQTLIDMAITAGVEVKFGMTFRDCVIDSSGRVTGVLFSDRQGRIYTAHADTVIGADGRNSNVAHSVGASVLRQSSHRTSVVYGYVPDAPNNGYQWMFNQGLSAGVIPTTRGDSCVFAACRPQDIRATFGNNPLQGLSRRLGHFDSDIGEQIRHAEEHIRLRRFAGAPGFIKHCTGPGWALVGDAGYFKDPATAHGITDALLDANRLTTTLMTCGPLHRYQNQRDLHAHSIFDITQQIASFDWDFAELKSLHANLNTCMKRQYETMQTAATPRSEVYSAKNSEMSLAHFAHAGSVSGIR